MKSNAKFIFSTKTILSEFTKLKNISDIVAYSVKSNPYISFVLEDNTNSNFLIHCINELKYIKDKKKIWYMLHSPDLQELKHIFEQGIDKFIVDKEKDLNLLLNFIENNNRKITLLLRMRVKEHTVSTGKFFVYGFYSQTINDLICTLKNHKNIEKIGVHFHRKTQNLSEWSLMEEITHSLSKETLDNIDFLNIGGGIPVVYKNVNPKNLENIFKKINDLKLFLNSKNIKLIIEPGRGIAAPAGKLITTIKDIVDKTIFIDASLFNCSMDTLVFNTKLLVEGELDKNSGNDYYLIKGFTPASEDIFRYRVYFKKDYTPKIGNKIIFLNAGAYIYYTDFLNLDKPKIEFVE